jgi:multiple sugar transport system ATP-binding protein
MASVTLEGVRKVYGDGAHAQVAVHGVDLAISDGEFVVLVGPSGCGKSTTLRMIAGLETITSGRLSIGERVVNDVSARDRDIAMVFQNYALYPHMNAYENMAFALKLRGVARHEIDARVQRAAAVLGIESLLSRKPKQMSGGQRQRVALGRALVREPKVFLFDEPLSNLDAVLRVQMRRELLRLHQQLRATMIYVTHDQVEAMTLGDRIVVLDRGHVQQTDTPLALYERPANVFVAGFIGSPPMNLLPGRLEQGPRFRTLDGVVSVTLARETGVRGDVIIGVRPEHVLVQRTNETVESVAARVEFVERLGSEALVHLHAGSHEITARVSVEDVPVADEVVAVRFAPEHTHLFDAASTRRLGGDS